MCVNCSLQCINRAESEYESRACVIPNPIDTHIFCNEHMVKTLSDSPEVVYSGRVHREKGLDILVKAVTRLHGGGGICWITNNWCNENRRRR